MICFSFSFALLVKCNLQNKKQFEYVWTFDFPKTAKRKSDPFNRCESTVAAWGVTARGTLFVGIFSCTALTCVKSNEEKMEKYDYCLF